MDFLALQTAVFGELNEDSTNPVFWSLADVKDAINEGYEEMSEISEWYETTYPLTLSAGTRYYDLFAPTVSTSYPQILDVVKVYDSTVRRWLTPITTKKLDLTNPVWEQAESASPEHYILRGCFRFGVFPLPTETRTLTLYTHNIPQGSAVDSPALVLDTDEPGFPVDFHHGIVSYAVYRLLCEDGEYKKALYNYAEFAAASDLLRKWTSNRGMIPMTRVAGGRGLWI